VKEAESEAPVSYPFVASRSSTVFHRADCRWAQNIAAHNRVGYRTREEALQDGKRLVQAIGMTGATKGR